MTEVYREERATEPENPTAEVEKTDQAEPVTPRGQYRMTVIERIIYLVGGILITLLAVRFLLSLLGANSANSFANFIYTASHPFAAPFFSLFSYQEHLGVGRFELGTLVAIAVYAIVMVILAKISTLARPTTSQ